MVSDERVKTIQTCFLERGFGTITEWNTQTKKWTLSNEDDDDKDNAAKQKV